MQRAFNLADEPYRFHRPSGGKTRTQRRGYLRCNHPPLFAVGISHPQPRLKVLMLNNKKRFANTVADQFRMSATWRQAKADRFSHDGRNADAARRLRELESQVVVSDDIWEEIEPLASDHAACLAAMSETNRDVGFRKHPRDFSAWLENFLSNLTLRSVAA